MAIDPEDPDLETATFGRMVEDFLAGPIGSYLIELAKEEEEKAMKALRIADPEDSKLIRKFQNDAYVAGRIIEWIADAVNKGDQALKHLQEQYNGD